MQLSEYTIARESVLVETTATLEKSFEIDSTVKLACTETRVVFADESALTDIRLESIDEVRVTSPTYLNRYAGWALLFATLAVLTYALQGQIPAAERFVTTATALLLFASVLAVGLAVSHAKWTVVLKTPQSVYRFIGDEALTNVPHAVRGVV